jgi:hypothetical protein
MNAPIYCKDALALHQAWMQMGFDPGDIFVTSREGALLVQLRAHGEAFTVSIDIPDKPDDDTILGEWQTAAALYNGMPQEWREANYQRWREEANTVDMVRAMVSSGIYRAESR